MQDFPSPSRAPWPSAYEGMISSRGVAKKRRTQELAGIRVKCSRNVVITQQSWHDGNHLLAPIPHCTLGGCYPNYSTLTLAALITGHHFAISAFCQAPSASGAS